jgi:hypothetical protein
MEMGFYCGHGSLLIPPSRRTQESARIGNRTRRHLALKCIYTLAMPYGKMPSVNAMVAAQNAVKDEPGAFAQALANGQAFD